MGNRLRRLFGGGDPNPQPQVVIPPKATGPKSVKLILVGDATVGKSCMIVNYQQQTFDENYEPSVLDVFKGPKLFENKEIQLEIHDTSGDRYLGSNRQVCYNKADVFMLCVAVNNQLSLDNVSTWKTEIRQVCPNTPIMLIGTKSDLRPVTQNHVTRDDLQRKADDMGL